MYKDNGHTEALICKVVDEFLLAGPAALTDSINQRISDRFRLGTIARAAGTLRYFGLNITQSPSFYIVVDADNRISQLQPYPISRPRRKQLQNPSTHLRHMLTQDSMPR